MIPPDSPLKYPSRRSSHTSPIFQNHFNRFSSCESSFQAAILDALHVGLQAQSALRVETRSSSMHHFGRAFDGVRFPMNDSALQETALAVLRFEKRWIK
jgi:hypothetical protein